MIDLGKIQDWYAKQKIDPGVRVEFYEAIIILMENNTNLNNALQKMYDEYSDSGKKFNKPQARLVWNCLESIQRGKKLTSGLRGWIPEQELSMLSAGEEAGKLITSLNECIRLITVKARITSSIMKAVSYPIILAILTAYMLSIISTKLMPKMEKMSDPTTWVGNGHALYVMSFVTTNYGLYIAILIVLGIIWFLMSLPRRSQLFSGGLRVILDGIPPWSLYRVMLGATFLLNLSLLLKNGIRLQKALSMLALNASPWLKQRIDAINSGVSNGYNIGYAMRHSGYDFPDKKSIAFLVILGDSDGVEEVLNNIANRWIEKTIKYIDSVAGIILLGGIVVIGIIMGIVMLGSNDIANQITQSAGSRH